MTDKIDKFLSKLSTKEVVFIEDIFFKLRNGKYTDLDIKKLEGQTNIFRVKKGQFRVIIQIDNFGVHLINIARRNEKTYRNF